VLGIKDPIGKQINEGLFMQGTIIGIVDQFNGMSSKEQDPLVVIRYKPNGSYLNCVYARINAANTAATINFISKIHKQFFAQEKFDFSFVDDRMAHLYDSEIRLTKLFNIFASLAILLSSTGLLSLISLVVRNRTKEVGIRKILGASVGQIFILLSKNFLVLVFVALLIASPLAWWAMNKWLEGYAYRTSIPWWVFLITGLLAVFIAMATISYQTIRAATANPLKSLRTE
jgi:putative ABC transport system permease protein